MYKELILNTISVVLAVTDRSNAAKLIKLIDQANRIFLGGAGRSGLVSRFFAMRLVHSGYQVNVIGETVTPAIKAGDLLVMVSGSGSTKSLLPLVEIAKSKGAKIVVVSMKKNLLWQIWLISQLRSVKIIALV